ncbi:MAG: SAM-dependent chlorinase/fluorinase [Anaerolineaceae bacterium]|nr:SAM-dependent chlorinase/fluorinase [Anaerolineaceae bacterium]
MAEKIGSMSDVILKLAPETKLVHLTHDIPSDDVLGAAVILSRHFYYFLPHFSNSTCQSLPYPNFVFWIKLPWLTASETRINSFV